MTSSNPYSKWQVYCIDENAWKEVWNVGASVPTTCPTNAQHKIDANRVRPQTRVQNVQSITVANSPFTCTRYQAYAVDTSGGNVNISLPPSSGRNNGRDLFFLKTSAANSVTLDAYASEKIDGALTKVITTLNAVTRVHSNGDGTWSTRAAGDTSSDLRLDTTTPGLSDIWLFREVYANATTSPSAVKNTWTARVLNETTRDAGSDVTRSGNTLTISEGTYYIMASAAFYGSSSTRTRFYNITTGVGDIYSLSTTISTSASINLDLSGPITVPPGQTYQYQLQYYISNTATGSLGRANGNGTGTIEVYVTVQVQRLW